MANICGNGGKSSPTIERWLVTLCCPLDPRLFAPRFRQGVGTLVTHRKAGVCARISIKYCEQNALKKAHSARNVGYLDNQRSLTEAVSSSITRSGGTAARVRQGCREFRGIVPMCTVYTVIKYVTP